MKHFIRSINKTKQAVFAGVLNVSPSLVRAWERGARNPEGAPQRLLQVAEKVPTLFDDFVFARSKPLPAHPPASAKRARLLAAKKVRRYAKTRSSPAQQ